MILYDVRNVLFTFVLFCNVCINMLVYYASFHIDQNPSTRFIQIKRGLVLFVVI